MHKIISMLFLSSLPHHKNYIIKHNRQIQHMCIYCSVIVSPYFQVAFTHSIICRDNLCAAIWCAIYKKINQCCHII